MFVFSVFKSEMIIRAVFRKAGIKIKTVLVINFWPQQPRETEDLNQHRVRRRKSMVPVFRITLEQWKL